MFVNALMDIRRIKMGYVETVNQFKEEKYFHVSLKIPQMVFGLMVNNVMMQIMTQVMVVIIFRLLQVIFVPIC